MKTIFLATFILLGSTARAFAGQAGDSTREHFAAIGDGNMTRVMAPYGASPQLNWVGGLFDGLHSGTGDIADTWGKFCDVHGPMQVVVSEFDESSNTSGATVVAKVTFTGKSSVTVRYVAHFRSGKLVSEIWQVGAGLAKNNAAG